MMSDTRGVSVRLGELVENIRSRFVREKRVLSFDEYLTWVAAQPYRATRDAARLLRDCFDAYGTAEVGGQRRFRLFDLPFAESGRARDALVGQEAVQEAVYRALCNFAKEGRINRLVLLHGPNGSAKSTFVNCMMRGLEAYAASDEGATYTFSWVFPRGRDGRALGFGSTDDSTYQNISSYAHLPDAAIDLRLENELRENPLLLIPATARRELLARAYRDAGESGEPPPRAIAEGELGQKSRLIADALMTAYRGDFAKVLAHVRVERVDVSARYRRGAVTVGPQMAVDAHERQITMDRSLAALPASLASVSLFTSQGDLVDAAGGILEFSDLLKRPLDAWRYLLLAVEEGEVALQQSILPLNTVFVATSNDVHLKAFREHHEYRSFRGRLTLVRVPYLVDYLAEQSIYDAQVLPQLDVRVAPHATFVAALWGVLTRLRAPDPGRYTTPRLGNVVASLTPLEKAHLYADGMPPDRLGSEDAAVLRAHLDAVRWEPDSGEGSSGASPRELRNVLLDAAQDPAGLTPLAVLARLRSLCEHEDHDFLKERPVNGYHDARGFVDVVREAWLDRVDEEVRRATGLVAEEQYAEVLDRYVTTVASWLKGERIPNAMTGKDDLPDAAWLEGVETMLGVTRDHATFRKDLISAVAAYAMDHPGQRPVLAKVFPRHLQALRDATWAARTKELAERVGDAVRVAVGEPMQDTERRARAERTLARMVADHGYTVASAGVALAELLSRRYTR